MTSDCDISTFFPIDNDNDNGINKKKFQKKNEKKTRSEYNEKF